MDALANRSQFNIVEFTSGWKVDFIIAEDSEYCRIALGRRRLLELAGTPLYFASPEDVLIAKLRWAKMGGSDRQLQDATGILRTQQTHLDLSYVERWVIVFGLQHEWGRAQQDASG